MKRPDVEEALVELLLEEYKASRYLKQIRKRIAETDETFFLDAFKQTSFDFNNNLDNSDQKG